MGSKHSLGKSHYRQSYSLIAFLKLLSYWLQWLQMCMHGNFVNQKYYYMTSVQ